MKLEVTIYGKKEKVELETIKEEVIRYYDAVGIKHFYEQVEEMDNDELIKLYELSFASK